jgi:hypothetical protein
MEALSALQAVHSVEMRKLAGQVMALRVLLDEHGIDVPDDAGEAALLQFRRLRNALECVYLYFTQRGGVPEELLSWFRGTILT